MQVNEEKTQEIDEDQYSVGKIIFIWVLVVVPMAILGWIVGPAIAPLIPSENQILRAGVGRLIALTIGLIWQFIFSMILVKHECGDIKFHTIKKRLRLNGPIDPKTEKPNKKLWLMLIPFAAILFVLEVLVAGLISFSIPEGFDLNVLLESPDVQQDLIGAWWFFILFLIMAIFNTIFGEEFIFRGILLPKMKKAFGKWDGVMNGILMGGYHWHQPWMIFAGILSDVCVNSFIAKRYKSTWLSIILHSIQSFIILFLIFGIVAGLA